MDDDSSTTAAGATLFLVDLAGDTFSSEDEARLLNSLSGVFLTGDGLAYCCKPPRIKGLVAIGAVGAMLAFRWVLTGDDVE